MSESNSFYWQPDVYELLDFGGGRKLERFGEFILDRPSPAAADVKALNPAGWSRADARVPQHIPELLQSPWTIRFPLDPNEARSQLSLELKLTPFGHVGLFPEQLGNWQWLFDQVRRQPSANLKALNLFAYTGAATLALAAAGAEVVHIDASSPSVAWARRNAYQSDLEERPIRWIVEDAFKFVAREFRRGNRYEVIVLDPPGYGHTPSGKPWNLAERWKELLNGCLQLLPTDRPSALLWTGHGDYPTVDQLSGHLLVTRNAEIVCGRSLLNASTGGRLDAGYFLRAELAGAE